MKKFMIFLLMAFLYLGTCQARSEASHPDNAKLKLLSWVTPTPSQSFLTRSADVQEDPIEIAVSIQGPHEACAQSLVTLTAVVNYEGDVSNFHYVWKMDGEALVAGPNVTMSYGGQTISFIPDNLFQDLPDNPVTHEFTVEVSYGSCSVTVSPIHEFTIDPETQLEIMIPAFACDNQTSTTITAMLTHGVTPDQYKWLVISHEENADNNVSDTLQYLTYVNELVIDNAVMANADSIGVTPVFNHAACNADTFWRKDLPNYEQMHTLVITGDNAICQNAPATMTATKVEHATYVWAGPDPHVADTTGNVFVTTVPGVYAVTMTDTLNGCDATAQFTITQYGANLQLTANQTVVCAGEPVVLNANLTGFDNQNVAYTWNTGATASTITVFPNADSTIIVTAHAVGIDTTSELSVACTISDTIQIYATKGSKITTQVVVDKNSVCIGDVAYFTATASDNSVNTYTWYLDGVEIPGENLNILVLSMNDFGIHYVVAKAVVGDCDTAVLSSPTGIIVNHIPEISFTGNNVVCDGDTAMITVNVNDEYQGYSYEWSNNTTNNPLKTVAAGMYSVTVTNDVTHCSVVGEVNVTTFGADLQLTADKMELCLGEMVTIHSHAQQAVCE